MPKEQINTPSLGIVIDKHGNELEYIPEHGVPEGGDALYDPALHVHWRRPEAPDHLAVLGSGYRGGVQVSLEVPADYLRHRAARLDESVVNTSIFTNDLTRLELNRLIRTLRRARDAAYGADE